jgi:hypothetical protein
VIEEFVLSLLVCHYWIGQDFMPALGKLLVFFRKKLIWQSFASWSI